ncbi:uncharacterized protein LOC135389463 [Ornithodoros turicata]|uniref:uncharacterized protein LOC135389463 n=1 Tax=Ornithodoros turicata TaxID=34597 RepID=UPI00313A227E
MREEKDLFLLELDPSQAILEAALPPTPLILSCGSPYESSAFFLAADQRVMTNNLPDFRTALATLLGVYFVFNIEYPSQLECSLEFMQRCFLGINSPVQYREKRKRSNMGGATARVLSLFTKLKDFEAKKWVLT